MSVQSDLILAPADAADDVRASESPVDEWDGFSFKGMDNVKIATLLPDADRSALKTSVDTAEDLARVRSLVTT